MKIYDLPVNDTGITRDITGIDTLSEAELLYLLDLAAYFEAHPNSRILDGRVVAALFFEPSTRTRLSFETAVLRLGGKVIGFSDPNATSTSKGETLNDTIKIVSNYADLIVMRHYLEGAATLAAEATDVPIINAGDGAHQHPSQTMLDLYSIRKTQGRLDNLTITMVGDLKYGRTVHSLLMAMSHFKPKFIFCACEELKMPQEFIDFCDTHGLEYELSDSLTDDIIAKSDILYMTRVQRERFADLDEYERVKDNFILSAPMLKNAKPTMKVLHPLPRVNEITTDVDELPCAYWFEQARNGLFARQAMICRALGIEPEGLKAPAEQPKAEKPKYEGEARCANPKCVVNTQPVRPRFHRAADGTAVCHFCEHAGESVEY